MRSSLECVPCMAAQAVEAVRRTVHDEAEREKMIKRILRRFARIDFSEPPPVAACELYRIIRRATGIADPYRGAKDRFTAMALKLLPAFEREIAHARDPFDAALRLAIAGNVIDLGVRGDLTEEEAHHAMQSALDEPVAGDVDGFRDEVRAAGCILYLADNAGELVFDIPLLRAMPAGSVTVAVRGEPVINDATLEDAEASGIPVIARVISNGSGMPGTVLRDCSREFRRLFERADLVVAKGQGNYETLCDTPRSVSFLFKVKCPVVAAHSGFKIGSHVLVRGGND